MISFFAGQKLARVRWLESRPSRRQLMQWGGAEVGTVAVCVALRSTFGAHHCGGFAFLSGVILKGVASHTLLDTDDLAECNLMLREEKKISAPLSS